ncbi:MAG: GTP-binding protein [Spirochaetes bacterium]|nr:GTP-binding protein [Spirochaetota bacterium]
MNPAYKLKIIMLGDFAVGKTSLIRRFVYDEFNDSYLTTIGVKVTRKELDIGDFGKTDLLLWDIAGNDKYTSITPEYIKGASGGIIVADITRKNTIESIGVNAGIIEKYIPNAMISVALNKTDLMDDSDNAINFTEKIRLQFNLNWNKPAMLTSAKTGRNVENLLVNLATSILKRQK